LFLTLLPLLSVLPLFSLLFVLRFVEPIANLHSGCFSRAVYFCSSIKSAYFPSKNPVNRHLCYA
jgi:hypothetical protein